MTKVEITARFLCRFVGEDPEALLPWPIEQVRGQPGSPMEHAKAWTFYTTDAADLLSRLE